MKIASVVRYSSFVLFFCFGLSSSAGEFIIAERGKSADCRVVVTTSLGATEDYAATELKDYVERLTGVRLGSAGSRQITITRDDSRYGTDGFNVRVSGPTLAITGGKRGVIYGVYELLETYGGVGWFSPNRTVVPTAAKFAVPPANSTVGK